MIFYIGPDSDFSENVDGTEGNGIYDTGEEFTDDNLDGNYDDLSDEELYNSENELWHWKVTDGYDLSQVCKNCTELRVKGEPAIDNLKYIIVGVITMAKMIYLVKVLLDELRMTGVKNEKGKAFRLEKFFRFFRFIKYYYSYERKDVIFICFSKD